MVAVCQNDGPESEPNPTPPAFGASLSNSGYSQGNLALHPLSPFKILTEIQQIDIMAPSCIEDCHPDFQIRTEGKWSDEASDAISGKEFQNNRIRHI